MQWKGYFSKKNVPYSAACSKNKNYVVFSCQRAVTELKNAKKKQKKRSVCS